MRYKYSIALKTSRFLILIQNHLLRFGFSLFPSKIQRNCRTNISNWNWLQILLHYLFKAQIQP